MSNQAYRLSKTKRYTLERIETIEDSKILRTEGQLRSLESELLMLYRLNEMFQNIDDK